MEVTGNGCVELCLSVWVGEYLAAVYVRRLVDNTRCQIRLETKVKLNKRRGMVDSTSSGCFAIV